MAENQTLDERIESLLSMTLSDEQAIADTLDKLVKDFGVDEVQKCHVPRSKHKHVLIHEFVRLGLSKTIEHAIAELSFNINPQREVDGCTPLHLAYWYQQPNIAEILRTFKPDATIKNNYGESVDDLERIRESMMNIIWLDLGKNHQVEVKIFAFSIKTNDSPVFYTVLCDKI